MASGARFQVFHAWLSVVTGLSTPGTRYDGARRVAVPLPRAQGGGTSCPALPRHQDGDLPMS
ncbi:hypothetical protein CLM81_21195, partial [Streptomyces albidoflavus]